MEAMNEQQVLLRGWSALCGGHLFVYCGTLCLQPAADELSICQTVKF